MDDLDDRIAKLSPAKRALLLRRLRERTTGSALEAIPRRADGGPAPLSFAQQRLWFLAQWEPGSPLYHVTRALRLRGTLDEVALGRALDALPVRHESLRTAFVDRDGTPMQVVAATGAVPVVSVDVRGEVDGRDRALARVLADEASRPFDLARGPLLRALLVRLADDEHVLLLTLHHIVTDGWSMGILTRELAVLYAAHATGATAALPPLPIQYPDFAVWQRQRLAGDVLARQLAHWRARLAGAPFALALPTDHPRPPRQSSCGASHTFTVPPDLAEAVRRLAQREGATPFMVLLAAFQMLLQRYTGQDDIVVGSPIANRTRPELEGLIGFFANTLILRTDLSGNPTGRTVLQRVRETCLAAYEHEEIPFEKLVEELAPPRDPGRNPLVQAVLVLQNRPPPLELEGLAVERLALAHTTAKFDLLLAVTDGAGGMAGTIEYAIDLFEPSTVARLARHFVMLLEAVTAAPDAPLSRLALLTGAERRQVIETGIATATDYPRRCVHALFEAQAARTPEAVAVECAATRLTYRELDRRANQLARHLRARGVGPDVAVGLCMERSAEMIVGLLAILKAGGAYLPLDPTHPAPRLATMIGAGRVPLVLAQARHAALLPAGHVTIVRVDTDRDAIACEPTEPPASPVGPEHLAYVLFTSGSTGAPKAVAVPHRAVVRLVRDTDYARFGPDEVMLQLAPIAFDASTLEIWGALLNGGRLVVAPPGATSLEDIGRLVSRHGVTTLWLTAGLFHEMVDHQLDALRGVRQLLAGGDVLSVAHTRRALAALPETTLINGYGPTEGTTFTCTHAMTHASTLGASVPIGRPIANGRVYVLDAGLEPVPVGLPGELYLGGDGLARGYLGRPELTAERFVPDPFGAVPGARLYRTGDRVRWRADGTLEFLGRVDDQVKIRGFRVEPAEVEAALLQHGAVREAVVVAQGRTAGERHLVAYVIPHAGQSPAPRELRAFLRARLPTHMTPAAVVRLEALPLSANGKVDRRALPAPGAGAGEEVGAPVEPRDGLEIQLAKIWEAMLGVEPVGIHDDFFEIGGHSLLAVRVLTRINRVFQRSLPLAAVFEAPTIAQLAARLRSAGWSAPASSLLVVQPEGTRPPLFCIHGYAGFARLARHLGPEQPFYGLVQGLDGRHFQTRVEDMAAHYLREIRGVQAQGPYHLAGHSIGGLVALEMAHQLRAHGEDVALLALIDPSGASEDGAPRPAPEAVRDTAVRHWRRLRILERGARLPYLAARAQGVRASAQTALLAAMCRLYLRLGRPIPPTLRTFYVGTVLFGTHYPLAARAYVPRPYPGPLVLFAAGDRSASLRSSWSHVAAGGLEIQTVPGSHLGILKEPGIGVIAAGLQRLLAMPPAAHPALGEAAATS